MYASYYELLNRVGNRSRKLKEIPVTTEWENIPPSHPKPWQDISEKPPSLTKNDPKIGLRWLAR
jgi:hypothetical protein